MEQIDDSPIFEVFGKHYFTCADGKPSPGYVSRERAEAKYQEYRDYVINVPACHHPHRQQENE